MISRTPARAPHCGWPATSLIEVEAQPKTPFAARDWGELLIARQLAAPLFRELPGRRVTSDVFDRVHRVDAHTWKLRIAQTARWSDSVPITSDDVCRQIAFAARNTGSGALTGRFISRLRVHSPAELSITTWLPVGEIGRILISPAFGLVCDHGRSSGCFTAAMAGPDIIRLCHVSSRHPVDAVSGLGIAALREAAAEGTLAATSLLTGRLVGTSLPGYTIAEADLDILICLQLPPRLRSSHSHVVAQAIDRNRIAWLAHGLVRPATSAADLWRGGPADQIAELALSPHADDRHAEHDWTLEFTGFYPNAIVAASVADQLRERLGFNVTTRRVEYNKFLEPGQVTAAPMPLR